MEWKIRSKILLICHFCFLLGKIQKEFSLISKRYRNGHGQEAEFLHPNLTGTIVR